MLENFIEGHNKMNALRKKLRLKPIVVRWHNLFFDNKFLTDEVVKRFRIMEKSNISSLFHLITKVVYSKLCQLEGKEPSYDSPIYDIALALDEKAGDYGQLYLIILKKKTK